MLGLIHDFRRQTDVSGLIELLRPGGGVTRFIMHTAENPVESRRGFRQAQTAAALSSGVRCAYPPYATAE